MSTWTGILKSKKGRNRDCTMDYVKLNILMSTKKVIAFNRFEMDEINFFVGFDLITTEKRDPQEI